MKKKVFLLAGVLPCLLAAAMLFAFKSSGPESGKPVIEVKQAFDDSDAYWYAEMEALDEIVYDTWVEDGMPSGENLKTFNHYCCKSSNQEFFTPGEAARWVIDVAMGGRSNPNHVHYIDWGRNGCCLGNGFTWEPKVKYWTSEPCSEICNW